MSAAGIAPHAVPATTGANRAAVDVAGSQRRRGTMGRGGNTSIEGCLSSFIWHHFQYAFLQDQITTIRRSLDSRTLLAEADFSENIVFLVQNEVQSNYFNRSAASLMPMVLLRHAQPSSDEDKDVCVDAPHLPHLIRQVVYHVSDSAKHGAADTERCIRAALAAVFPEDNNQVRLPYTTGTDGHCCA